MIFGQLLEADPLLSIFARDQNRTHQDSINKDNTDLFNAWRAMFRNCYTNNRQICFIQLIFKDLK